MELGHFPPHHNKNNHNTKHALVVSLTTYKRFIQRIYIDHLIQ